MISICTAQIKVRTLACKHTFKHTHTHTHTHTNLYINLETNKQTNINLKLGHHTKSQSLKGRVRNHQDIIYFIFEVYNVLITTK